MSETVDYEVLGESEKVRLVLRVVPEVKETVKRVSRSLGISPSAYVTMLVRADETHKAASDRQAASEVHIAHDLEFFTGRLGE